MLPVLSVFYLLVCLHQPSDEYHRKIYWLAKRVPYLHDLYHIAEIQYRVGIYVDSVFHMLVKAIYCMHNCKYIIIINLD